MVNTYFNESGTGLNKQMLICKKGVEGLRENAIMAVQQQGRIHANTFPSRNKKRPVLRGRSRWLGEPT